MSNPTLSDFHLLAVNAGIIGSIFIFFSIAVQLPPTTIFEVNSKKWITYNRGGVSNRL